MNNNDILRRLRYTLDLNDNAMMELFALAGKPVTRSEVSNWLKKDDDPGVSKINDAWLAAFLTGFIIYKRGTKDGEQPVPEKQLNNNIILRKLKIALQLKDDDILEMLKLAGFRFGKHELSALFRNPAQGQYQECKDQVLRNFLHGMQLHYRGSNEAE